MQRRTTFYLCLFLCLIAASGGTWLYLKNEQAKKDHSTAFEQQRFDRERAEATAAEEKRLFVSHWIGQAKSELAAGQFDPTIAASKNILQLYPDEAEAKSLLTAATQAKAKSLGIAAKAADLLKMAIARDNGQYDQQALDWLHEAQALAPANPEIAAAISKFSAYIRILRVPGDFTTPADALAVARDRDRVVLNADTWQGPLIINAAIDLRGAGSTLTQVECSPESGSAITLGPDAKGAQISGITFRHSSIAVGDTRFSVALVRGGNSSFTDCKFTEASGHGLAVIEGGQATASHCRFTDNGWNGAAAIGNGSRLEVKDSEAVNNAQHGFEAWDSAALKLVNNRCEANKRNGIHADCGPALAIIEGNQLLSNQEYGLVLDSASGGKIIGNTARANQLGGIVIRASAANIPVTGNTVTLNQGPGIILEKGLNASDYSSNNVSQNSCQDILPDADLSVDEESPPAAPPQEAK
jgi:parallel beta-helix repeat protein